MNSSNWPRNRLLLALPSRDLKRLMPELEHIRCRREQILMDADSSLDHVFFPDNGVVSVVAVYANGSVIEMATIGREGCTGMQAFFGAKTSSVRLLVQIPGSAAKMSRAAFARAMESMPSFRNLMSAYIQAFLEQVLVSVACNGAHSLKERLARWLLMMRDRSDGDALPITQSLLAEMVGVQRPTITNAARELERAGLIERGRRQVTILDRQGLTEESCECYQLVKTRVTFHLPKTYTLRRIGNVHYRQHIPTGAPSVNRGADGGLLWGLLGGQLGRKSVNRDRRSARVCAGDHRYGS